MVYAIGQFSLYRAEMKEKHCGKPWQAFMIKVSDMVFEMFTSVTLNSRAGRGHLSESWMLHVLRTQRRAERILQKKHIRVLREQQASEDNFDLAYSSCLWLCYWENKAIGVSNIVISASFLFKASHGKHCSPRELVKDTFDSTKMF